MARDPVSALPPTPSETTDRLFARPLNVSRDAPLARALVHAVRVVAVLVTVPLLGAVAMSLWALPWQADGAAAVVTAAAWCGWLDATEDAG